MAEALDRLPCTCSPTLHPCPGCLAYARKTRGQHAQRIWTPPPSPPPSRSRFAEAYARDKAKGKCPRCPKAPKAGQTYCSDCLEARRVNAARHARRRTATPASGSQRARRRKAHHVD